MQPKPIAQLYPSLMVAVLLFAAALAIPQLNADAFSFDEIRTLVATGGAHYGSLPNLGAVLNRVQSESPDQAVGFALIAWSWAQLAGWTEFATRTLPFFAGMIAIALTYRLGRDLFHPFVGISAALILTTSIFFVTYMHKYRVFTLVALAVALTIWAYWRIADEQRTVSWRAAFGLVVGGTMIFYTHYFAVPLIVALGIYHLFVVPKNKRWWIPVGLAVIVALLFTPQLTGLLEGVGHNLERVEQRSDDVLSPLAIVWALLTYFGGGYPLLTIALLVPTIAVFYDSRVCAAHRRHLIMLYVALIGLMVGIIVMNEIAGVLMLRRIRYLMPTWIPLALIISVGFWRLYHWRPSIGALALLLWMVVAVAVYHQNTLMTFNDGDQSPVIAWRELASLVESQGEPDDLFVFQGDDRAQYQHYMRDIPRRFNLESNVPEWDFGNTGARDAKRVWWAVSQYEYQAERVPRFANTLVDQGHQHCATVYADPLLVVELYAQSPAYCPGGEPIVTFGNLLTLQQIEHHQHDNRLMINTGWGVNPDIPLFTYSLAFFLYDSSDQIVGQSDVGLDAYDGPYTPIYAEIDTATLSTGRYVLKVAAYQWETGERLPRLTVDDESPFTPAPIGTVTLNAR